MVPPEDARALRSQQALLKAGMKLLNNNPEASLSEIASHAGVGRATLYRQYETREKLIVAIAVHCLQRIDQVTAPIDHQAKSAMDAFRLIFELVLPLAEEYQFLLKLDHFIDADETIDAINAKQKEELTELVEYAKNRREISQSLPTDWIVHFINGLLFSGWMQLQEGDYTCQQVAKFAFSTFRNGIDAS